ncbi:MAG: hypothetical protein WAN04_11630 [Candidatus Udaeobacter sp.]
MSRRSHPSPSSSRNSSWFRELKEQIQYRLDNLFAQGALGQLLMILIFVTLVVLFGMSASFFGLFSPRNQAVVGINRDIDKGFWDTLWWSGKHLFDPSFLAEDYGATLPIVAISMVLSVMGLVLFGFIVGFITTSIEQRLARLRRGSSIVKESGHVVILGWNVKVIPILNLLADRDAKLRVVILAPREIEEMKETLRAGGIHERKMKVILRSGDPNDLAELKRVAFDKAFSIIILAYSLSDEDRHSADVEVIKSLMLLSAFKDWVGARPKMVGEIIKRHNVAIAEAAAKWSIPIVCSSSVASRLIVQAARQSGVTTVYSELFGFIGNQIFILGFPECTGRSFGDIACAFPDAIPIGVSRVKMKDGIMHFIPALKPGNDYVIPKDEWIIFVARNNQIRCDPNIPVPFSAMARSERVPQLNPARVLIIGWNSNIYDVLDGFDNYLSAGATIDVISNLDAQVAEQLLKEFHPEPFTKIVLRCNRAGILTPQILEHFDVLSRDCVIVLADESYGDADPDARTIKTLILLREIRQKHGENSGLRIIPELLNARNRAAVQAGEVDEVIVSPASAAMILTQISQQLMLTSVYDELLNPSGVEIYLKPAERYVEPGRRCQFNDLIFSAQKLREIALGVRIHAHEHDARKNHGIQINPPKDLSWEFVPGDCVIVLADNLYDT